MLSITCASHELRLLAQGGSITLAQAPIKYQYDDLSSSRIRKGTKGEIYPFRSRGIRLSEEVWRASQK